MKPGKKLFHVDLSDDPLRYSIGSERGIVKDEKFTRKIARLLNENSEFGDLKVPSNQDILKKQGFILSDLGIKVFIDTLYTLVKEGIPINEKWLSSVETIVQYDNSDKKYPGVIRGKFVKNPKLYQLDFR